MAAVLSQPCTSETRPEAERGYREGFTKGIETRTTGVATSTHVTEAPVPETASSTTADAAPTPTTGPDSLNTKVKICASAKDCKGGQFCKARADKVLVCMGEGKHGDYCESHVDCRDNGFCRTTGDGLKRCMKSGKNTICASSTDCEESLLCKSASGKNKVCR